jgi:hypothetical protein
MFPVSIGTGLYVSVWDIDMPVSRNANSNPADIREMAFPEQTASLLRITNKMKPHNGLLPRLSFGKLPEGTSPR